MNYNSLLGSKLAKYFNKKYGIITYSGTLAIEVALKSLRLKRKSKVLISSNVCYSIINTVLKLELVPVIKMPNNGLFFTNDDIDVVIDKEIIDCILLVHQFGILNNISKRKYKKLNIKIIEELKANLLCIIGEFFLLLTRGTNVAKDSILNCIAGAILILYVLAQKLGYSCNEVDDELRKKLKLGIAEEHEYEKEGKSLTKLQNHIKGRY